MHQSLIRLSTLLKKKQSHVTSDVFCTAHLSSLATPPALPVSVATDT